MVISPTEASTCANPIYAMVIYFAEASTCVLYYVVTPTVAAFKQVCHVRFVELLLLL